MTDAELRQYKNYLDKIRNYNSKPIMRKLKMEGIFKILSKHTK